MPPSLLERRPPRARRAPWLLLPAGLLALAVLAALLAGTLLISLAAPGSDADAPAVCGASARALKDVPREVLPVYARVAREYAIPWEILAAIGTIESAQGQNMGPSSAGALGWMQFMPASWRAFGVDGNGDGRKDPFEPEDAIPAAARHLIAGGAPEDMRAGLFSYNHAQWYVDDVLALAAEYRGEECADGAAGSGGLEPPPGSRLEQLVAVAEQIDSRAIPYCYGGGHGVTPARPTPGEYCWQAGGRKVHGSPDQGLDCSSSTSLLLQSVGYDIPTLSSGQFAAWGEPGRGEHVTIWANAGHVYVQIGSRFWGTSAENPRHGPGWHSARSGAGFVARHPPGL
jgi:Transglycosylase SLT domain